MIELKKHNGEIIHRCAADTMRQAVEDALARSINLDGANLSGCNLTKVNMSGANLSGVDFNNGVLAFANLEKCVFSQTNMTNVDLNFARAKNIKMRSVNMERANLIGADFEEAVLIHVNLYNTQTKGTRLTKALIVGAKNLSPSCRYTLRLKGAIFAKLKAKKG